MLVIVTYDVSTETRAGRRRLRRVAKACLNYGQRVQKSVFECRVNAATYELLEEALLAEIDPKEDSLRLYCLADGSKNRIKEFGLFRSMDFDSPLIL